MRSLNKPTFSSVVMRSAYCVIKVNPTPYAVRNTIVALPIFFVVVMFFTFFVTPVLAQSPDTQPSASGARGNWVENCVPCHGSTGLGDGPTAQSIENELPNFTDLETARQRVPANSFDVIKNGRIENLMPPWGNQLSDAEIWDLTAYVWNLSTSPDDLAAGETIYQENCAACHGENGNGDAPTAPADINDFTNLQAMVQQSQADLMAAYEASSQHNDLGDLSDQELWQSLDYIRTFSLAVPKPNGTLLGQAINATTNQPLADMEVILRVFQGNAEIDTRTAQTDSEGNYSFSKLPTDHAIVFVVEGNYEGIAYTSEAAIFVPDSNETTANLNVYDTTTNNDNIDIERLHYLLSFEPGAINAVQLFIMGNRGNQTYVGEEGQTFAFALPADATNVTFQNDFAGRFIETENGYTDTEPILPGEEGLIIAAIYTIPVEDDTYTVDVPVSLDTSVVNVLMRSQGVSLNSDQVEFTETRQVESQEFLLYGGGQIEGGGALSLELTGLNDVQPLNIPQGSMGGGSMITPGPPVDQNLLLWLALSLGGLAIIGAGAVYPIYRPRLVEQATVDHVTTHRQKLLLLLARLDDSFEAGEMDEQLYLQARAKYKAELAELMTGATAQ